MPPEEHGRTRDFQKVTEPPAGVVQASKGGLSCLIQKRDAARLQCDFQPESDGSLLTWAVGKGAGLNAADQEISSRGGRKSHAPRKFTPRGAPLRRNLFRTRHSVQRENWLVIKEEDGAA